MTVQHDVESLTPLAYPFSDGRRLVLEAEYARLRDTPGLARVQTPYGSECWLATRYDDVKTVLTDRRLCRSAAVGAGVPRILPEPPGGGDIITMDPPDHTRLRSLAARAFTERRVEQLRERTRQIVSDLVDEIIAAGQPADLVEHLGLPLPVSVICGLLGVPVDDQEKFRTWSQAFISTTLLRPETVAEYAGNIWAYIGELVARRRVEPADDLISAMVAARDERAEVSENELVVLITGILGAGYGSTAAELPNFVYVLNRFRDQWDLLVSQPELVPSAVEELLRYAPLELAATFARYATEDVELGGTLVRAGEAVLPGVWAANWDERVFRHADRVDITRDPNPHLAFGFGPHVCLGAALARMELREGLSALVRRLPTLRLAVAEQDLAWNDGLRVRGFRELPVTW